MPSPRPRTAATIEHSPTPAPATGAAAAVIASAFDIEALAPSLEAVLLSTDRPVPALRLAQALGVLTTHPSAGEDAEGQDSETDPAAAAAATDAVARAVALLNEQYGQTHRSFRIELLSGGYRVMTLPAFAERIAEFHRSRLTGKLTRASIETLAIIAYKQPLTRAALESIRGVSCGEVLKTLMDRRLVTVKGRAEELGRPMLYGTTKTFLDQFGLATIKDLPTLAELKPTP